jgi:hypothetical protein
VTCVRRLEDDDSLVSCSLANSLGQEETPCEGSSEDAHLHHGVNEVLSLVDDQFLLADEAVGESVPIDDEQVARFEELEQNKLQNQQVSNALGSHPDHQADDQTDEEALNDVFCEEAGKVHATVKRIRCIISVDGFVVRRRQAQTMLSYREGKWEACSP